MCEFDLRVVGSGAWRLCSRPDIVSVSHGVFGACVSIPAEVVSPGAGLLMVEPDGGFQAERVFGCRSVREFVAGIVSAWPRIVLVVVPVHGDRKISAELRFVKRS